MSDSEIKGTYSWNGDDPGRIKIVRDGEEHVMCNYAHDVVEFLLDKGKSTNHYWEKLLPILWEMGSTVHFEDADLLAEKLLLEAKLFNASVTEVRKLKKDE